MRSTLDGLHNYDDNYNRRERRRRKRSAEDASALVIQSGIRRKVPHIVFSFNGLFELTYLPKCS
jgi:hypothetical protein